MLRKTLTIVVLLMVATSGHTATVLAALGEVSSASIGAGHACAIASGRTWCWGSNDRAQTGRPPSPARIIAEPVPGTEGATLVAVGGFHSCAVLDGVPWCWGANDHGQLGNGTFDDRSAPAPIDAVLPGAVVQLAAGRQHTCARVEDGSVFCWGGNEHGQLGIPDAGAMAARPAPVALPAALHLSSTVDHTCAVSDGRAFCWGRNDYGQVGNGEVNVPQREPGAVVGLEDDQVAIGAGDIVTCAVDTTGDVRCFGSNYADQLGVPAAETPGLVSAAPVLASLAPPGVIDLRPGFGTTCVRTDDEAFCWGLDGPDSLGPEPRLELTAAAAPVAFAGRPGALCFVEDARLRCVGEALVLAQGGPRTRHAATAVEGLVPGRGLLDLALGFRFGCAVVADPDTRVLCWGDNRFGQLGQADRNPRGGAVEVPFPEQEPPLRVATGYDHACATTQPFRDIACWGSNRFGALGDGTTEDRAGVVATGINVGSRAIIGTGHGFTCATAPLGSRTVTCWGRNDVGQTGAPPSEAPVLEPFDIELPAVVVDLHVGDRFACAQVTGLDEGIFCWGEVPTSDDEANALNTGSSRPAGVRRLPGESLGASGPFSVCAGDPLEPELTCAGRNYFLAGERDDRGIFVGPRPLETPWEPAFTLFGSVAIGGRHACAADDRGRLSCLNLLGRACRFERATGLIGTPGQGISCDFGEELLQDWELAWQAVDGIPAGRPDAVVAGYDQACGTWGGDVLCWGVGEQGQLGAPAPPPILEEPAVAQREGAEEPGVRLPVTVDDALACPGFYVGSVSLRYPEADSGSWGLEMLLTDGDRRLQGGLNFGGYAVAGPDSPVPGYAAFDVNRNDGKRTVITLGMRTGPAGPTSDGRATFDVSLLATLADGSVETRFAERITLTDQLLERDVTVEDGFHVLVLDAVAAGDDLFLVSATAQAEDGGPGWFSSGAVVGGYLRADWSGFAAICTDDSQDLLLRTEARSTRGLDGAGDLRLEVLEGQTGERLYESAPRRAFIPKR